MVNFLLICFQVLLNTSAQLILKYGAKLVDFSRPISEIFVSMLSNGYVWCGGFIFVFSFILWIYLLNQFELSFLYPFNNFTLVLAALGGYFFFAEVLSFYRIFGIILISIGVFFVAKS